MIERIVIEYLRSKGFAVFMEIPTSLPDEFIVIQKTGSSIDNHINRATMAVQSYSTSMVNRSVFKARSLCQTNTFHGYTFKISCIKKQPSLSLSTSCPPS